MNEHQYAALNWRILAIGEAVIIALTDKPTTPYWVIFILSVILVAYHDTKGASS